MPISVVIPAYNAAAYLTVAIQSVLSQTQPPAEIIVVDDGSTDNTPDLIATFGDRIRCIRQSNSGVMAARNRGIQEARHDWIAFLDADDFWFPPKLALQQAQQERVGAPALICSGIISFTDRAPVPPPISNTDPARCVTLDMLLQRNSVSTSTVLVDKASLLKVGGFSQRYNHAEDWAVWLQLAAQHVPIWRLPQPLVAYRLAPNALGTRDPGYLRDVETRIIGDFAREHSEAVPQRIVSQALAGNYMRTAGNYDQFGRHWEAIRETARSIRTWPFSLSEYAHGNRLLRLRLCRRFLRGLLRQRCCCQPLPPTKLVL